MKKLHPTKLRNLADYTRSNWHVEVEPDMTIEDVMLPVFWQHHTERLQVNDLIDVIGQGFDIQLRVTGKGIGFVETRLLRKWVAEKADAKPEGADDVPEGYVVDHTPRTRWRVRLKDGGVEIGRDMQTRDDAVNVAVAHAMRATGVAA